MCDRPRLLNPLDRLFVDRSNQVTEAERLDLLQKSFSSIDGTGSSVHPTRVIFCCGMGPRARPNYFCKRFIKVITFWHSVPNSSINVLSVELVTAIVRSLSLQLYLSNSGSARSGRKFVRGFNRRARVWDRTHKKSRGAIHRISTKILNKVHIVHPTN